MRPVGFSRHCGGHLAFLSLAVYTLAEPVAESVAALLAELARSWPSWRPTRGRARGGAPVARCGAPGRVGGRARGGRARGGAPGLTNHECRMRKRGLYLDLLL